MGDDVCCSGCTRRGYISRDYAARVAVDMATDRIARGRRELAAQFSQKRDPAVEKMTAEAALRRDS